MMNTYYIASCVFTWHYPELSQMIQQYMTAHGIQVVRCCVPKYKLPHFTGLMPDSYKEQWQSLPDCADFQPGDTVYSLCHNCSAILEESKPGVTVTSLWEYIASDGTIPSAGPYGPDDDHSGLLAGLRPPGRTGCGPVAAPAYGHFHRRTARQPGTDELLWRISPAPGAAAQPETGTAAFFAQCQCQRQVPRLYAG